MDRNKCSIYFRGQITCFVRGVFVSQPCIRMHTTQDGGNLHSSGQHAKIAPNNKL